MATGSITSTSFSGHPVPPLGVPSGVPSHTHQHGSTRLMALLHTFAPCQHDLLQVLAWQETGIGCFQHPTGPTQPM